MERNKLTCVTVDDDPLMLAILNAYIRRVEGLSLEGEYNNYFEAATNITRIQPDILFLDINMPGLSGIEVLEILDKKPLVIIVSADLRMREELKENPYVVDFLEKPVFYNHFRATMGKLLTAYSV